MCWIKIPLDGCEYFINYEGQVINSKGKLLKQNMWGGYLGYRLVINGKVKRFSTHRILAILFIKGFHPDLQVNHKDGNKLNNKIDNLEWVTAKENIQHAHATGLARQDRLLNNEKLEKFLRLRSEGLYWKDAMKLFNISKGTVFNYDQLGRGG